MLEVTMRLLWPEENNEVLPIHYYGAVFYEECERSGRFVLQPPADPAFPQLKGSQIELKRGEDRKRSPT